MYRPRTDSTSARTAVGELRRAVRERPVGYGVSGVGVFLGLLTGVRLYLLPQSHWRFELGVVTALAGITVATGIALAVSDVPVARARRAESLCLKGLGVMGLSTLGLFLVGTPFERGMATVLCLPDVLLTGGAVGGLGIGMLRPPWPGSTDGGSDDQRGRATDRPTAETRGGQTAGATEPTIDELTERQTDEPTEQERDGTTGTETEDRPTEERPTSESTEERRTEGPTERRTDADHPGDSTETVPLPIPSDETPESALDVWLEVLADPRCRHVLHCVTRTPDGVATVDELATDFEDPGGLRPSRPDRAAEERTVVSLHHTVLPKLDEAGVLDYDARTQTVRYRETPTLEAWLAAVETLDNE